MMKLQQNDKNLVMFDMDGKPFKNLADQMKYTLAYYRCSQECIDHVFKRYTEAEIADVIDGLGNPMDYVAEPDHALLELCKLLTGVYFKMPAYIPNDHTKKIIKTNSELAARNMYKIRDMMKNAGIIVNKVR